jgi:hypothetical protein
MTAVEMRRDPCAYCQAARGDTLDHIRARTQGGTNDYNRIGACKRCNDMKGSTPLLLFLVKHGYPINHALTDWKPDLSKRERQRILRGLRKLERSAWRIRTRPALPPVTRRQKEHADTSAAGTLIDAGRTLHGAMTPLETVGAVFFVAGLFGFVGWMLAGLIRALRAERARQDPARRSSPLVLIVVALVAFVALAAATDPQTARRLALAGIVIVGIAEGIRRKVRR